MTDLKGKTVLVTGASAGIGEAIAKAFSVAGSRVIICARRLDRLEELEKQLDGEALALQLNVRDRDEVDRTIAGLPDDWKAIDILVNNAGLSRGLGGIDESNPDGWEDMIDTNVKGLLYITRAVLPGMKKRGRGHIINIGSIAGHEVYPGGNVYCATKHAVDALTKGLRIDLVKTSIRVTTVDPGLVETEFSQVRFYGDTERAKTVYQGYSPLRGEDIADAVVWAASRPQHVLIAQMTVLPKDQASATILNKQVD